MFAASGAAIMSNRPMVSQNRGFHLPARLPRRRPHGLAEARITHNDVDHLMSYDAPVRSQGQALRNCRYTASRISGLCCRARPGLHCRAQYGTRWQIAAQHQWRRPFLHALQENVRQLRGTAPDQIRGAKILVCHRVGAIFAAAGAIIMSNEPRRTTRVATHSNLEGNRYMP